MELINKEGINILIKNSEKTPRIALVCGFLINKAEKKAGIYSLFTKLLMQGTKKYSNIELLKLIEEKEIEQKRNLPAKELRVVGSSYLDFCMGRLPQRIGSDNFSILIAPSWGAHSLLAKFGEKLLDELVNNTSYDIVVRPHPQSMLVEKDLVENLQRKYIDCARLKWDFSADNMQVMANSDILISDFS